MGTLFEHGCVLFDLRRYADAERAFREALAEDPDSAVAHAMRAAALVGIQQNKSAEIAVGRAIELSPELGYAFYVLSIIHENRGRPGKSKAAILEAIRLEQNPTYYCQLASHYLKQSKFRESLEVADRGLALQPNDSALLVLRGKSLLGVGRIDEAQTLLRAALKANPENADAHHAMGTARLLTRSPIALDALREARRLDPLRKNDSDSIALAYGCTLQPFRSLDRFVIPWHGLSPKQRWLAIASLGVFVLASSHLVTWVAGKQVLALPILYVVVANIVAFSFSFDRLASATAILVARRETGASRLSLLFQPFVLIGALAAHFYATGIGVLCGIVPELGLLLVAILLTINFLVGGYRLFQQANLIGRALLILLYIPSCFGILMSGALAISLFGIDNGTAVALALPFFFVTFFADDIYAFFNRFVQR